MSAVPLKSQSVCLFVSVCLSVCGLSHNYKGVGENDNLHKMFAVGDLPHVTQEKVYVWGHKIFPM